MFHYYCHYFHFRTGFHIVRENMWCLAYWGWLISLNIMTFSSNYFLANDVTLFFFMLNSSPLYISIYISIHICLSSICLSIYLSIYIISHLLFAFICSWAPRLIPQLIVNSVAINIPLACWFTLLWMYAQEWDFRVIR
jgi:hypothetical protein